LLEDIEHFVDSFLHVLVEIDVFDYGVFDFLSEVLLPDDFAFQDFTFDHDQHRNEFLLGLHVVQRLNETHVQVELYFGQQVLVVDGGAPVADAHQLAVQNVAVVLVAGHPVAADRVVHDFELVLGGVENGFLLERSLGVEVQVDQVHGGQAELLLALVESAAHDVLHDAVFEEPVLLLCALLEAVVGDHLLLEEAAHLGVIVRLVQQIQFEHL